MSKKTFWAAVLFMGLAATATAAQLPLDKMNFLVSLTVKDQDKASLVETSLVVRQPLGVLSAKINQDARQVIVELPDTYVDPPKKSFGKLGSAVVEKAQALQINKNTVMLTFQLGKNFELRPERVTVKVLEDRVAISFWKADPGPAEPAPEAGLNMNQSAAKEGNKNAASDAADSPIDLSKVFPDIVAAGAAEAQKVEVANEAKPAPAAAPGVKDAAEKAPQGASFPGAGVPDMGRSLIKMTSALFAVLALILILYALARKFMKGSPLLRLPSRKTPVRVLFNTSLGPKKSMCAVDVAGEVILLGVAETSIQFLMKVEKPETLRCLLGTPAADDFPKEPDFPARPIVVETARADIPVEAPKFRERFTREIEKYREAAETPIEDARRETPEPETEAELGALRAIRERVANMKKL